MVILPGSYESRNCRKNKKFFIHLNFFIKKNSRPFRTTKSGNPVNQFSKAMNIGMQHMGNNLDDDINVKE